MRVRFKKTAIDDIQASAGYIAEALHNRAAAKRLTEAIYKTAMLLEDTPYLGARPDSKYPVETDLRFFIASKHMIFYRIVNEEYIEVTRVLDGRRDYLSILFVD